MKKIYLLIILLVSGFGYAQGVGSYSVNLGITDLNIKVSISGNCGSRLESWLAYSNSGDESFFNQPIGDGQNLPRNWPYTFSSSKKLTRIKYYSEGRKWHGGFNSGCKNDNNSTEYINVSYGVTEYYLPNYFTRLYYVRATLKILPKLHIQPVGVLGNESDILPTADKITIKSDTGFLSTEYNWQYSLNPDKNDESSWKSLPYNTASISVNALDVLGQLDETSHGKKVHFRQIAYNKAIMSNIVTYNVRLSAPRVDSSTPKQPTCSDSKDGSIKLVFNRILLPGEQLNYTLLDVDTNTPANYNGVLSIGADKTFVIKDLRSGKYMLQLIGFKDGLSTATDKDRYDLKAFSITPPPPLDFTLSPTNIKCKGAKDGIITITPTGGTRDILDYDYYSLDEGSSWKPFPNNKPYPITGLDPGTYKIMVKDMNGCVAKTQTLVNGVIQLGADKVVKDSISEPLLPLTIKYTLEKDPTFFNASNGMLVAAITGGTIYDTNSYSYEWKNSNGVEMPVVSEYNSVEKTYYLTLENVPAGNYKLTVRDKNYDSALNKAGCSIIESSKELIEPKKIVVTLEISKEISCNSANLGEIGGSNKASASDAILIAKIVGGKKLKPEENNGIPYYFSWKKLNNEGKWEELKDKKDSIASGLSEGTYSLNVTDANKISQGTYSLVKQLTEVATEETIIEPKALEVEFESADVSCYEGNNGWAIATVKNGEAPYKYVWYNVEGGIIDQNKISQLTFGEYFVEITDAKGCFVKDSISIGQPPSKLSLKFTDTKSPTFFGATNGKIVAEVTGGTHNDDKTYDFVWKNKAGIKQTTTTQTFDDKFIITLDGIPAGEYILTVTDKNYKNEADHIINCSILDSVKVLKEPAPLKINIEVVRTISCNSTNEFGNAKDTTPKDGQRDESQDGILIAHVSGGVTFSTAENGLPYQYFWKKLQPDKSWKDLGSITDSIAPNLSQGKYSVNVKDSNGIMLGIYVNNTLAQQTDVEQSLIEPAKLTVTITKGDVYCKDGNDGWATATASGGTEPYYFHWSNDVKIDKNTILKKGEYWVFVTDGRGCTTQESVIISEPTAPLAIKYKEVLNPSFYKATNGKIVVEVTGGTIFSDNSYWFEWKNSKGKILTTTTTNFNNGIYTISLSGLPEDTYSLTIRDRNYNDATSKKGCTVANSVTALDDPDPLEVTFEVVRTISCNVSNEFGNETDANPLDGQRDESQDGILVAKVKGGIQLAADKNNGLPYFYTWKKLQKNGLWVIWNDHDETAENISDGTYALNIEDANEIKLGTYVNNVLVKEIDVTQDMPEPAKLSLTFTKFDVGCTTGDDGWAEAHVSGGTSPYEYEWTNEATIPRIDRLTTNNYFVKVTDAKGCVVQGSIFVGDPNGIVTTETITNPICFDSKDGSIALNVSGGNLPYTYLWNTGATTKDLNNVKAGNYEVAITCPNCCVYKKRFVLKDPNPIVIDLGKDRTLCNDQILDLDATIADEKAQYNWTSTNGFTSNEAKVSLTKSGTYYVKVTSGLGCISEDDIVIKTNQVAISSEFLLSSQAYLDEEVILVNTSNPFGESTKWMIPKGVKIVEEQEKYITLKFDAIGVYSIGLEQTQGECYATYNKSITVEQRSTLPDPGTTSKFITDFIVTPNPSNGNFAAIVNLENNSAINLRLFSTTGQFTMTQKKDSGKKKYEVDFNTSLESGMYILVLETEQQTLVKKIIIY